MVTTPVENLTVPDASAVGANRREHFRVPGPFDGCRVGLLDTPLRIFDLSRGGCFVIAMYEQQPGVKITMEIELPGEGRITVKAETLNRRGELGFAVRFVDVDIETAGRLDRVLDTLQEQAGDDEHVQNGPSHA